MMTMTIKSEFTYFFFTVKGLLIPSDLPRGLGPVLSVVRRVGLLGKLKTWICVVMTTIKLQH